MSKIESLAKFLECEVDDINQGYDENTFEYGRMEYKVLTEDEAEEATKEYIIDSLWAFNTDFILNHSSIDSNTRVGKAFQKMQSELCEDANEIVKAVITDIDDFVQDAIDADGRGHFLSSYDGEENEEDEYYIYRTN